MSALAGDAPLRLRSGCNASSHSPPAAPPALPAQIGVLRSLLAAGAAPLPRLLPALLRRYEGLALSGGLAGKLREGMGEVLAQAVPDTLPRSRSASSASSSGGGSGGGGGDTGSSAAGGLGTVVTAEAAAAAADLLPNNEHGARAKVLLQPVVLLSTLLALSSQQLRQLLHVAVVCRDEPRCHRLLTALAGSPEAGRWPDPEANCALLVAAASHGMAAVLRRLLAQPPAVPGGTPPFNPNMVRR